MEGAGEVEEVGEVEEAEAEVLVGVIPWEVGSEAVHTEIIRGESEVLSKEDATVPSS